jgi:hypothetical protein
MMQDGQIVTLDSGEDVMLVSKPQRKQTKGWWVDPADTSGMPNAVEDLWTMDTGDRTSPCWAANLCLCPMDQVDRDQPLMTFMVDFDSGYEQDRGIEGPFTTLAGARAAATDRAKRHGLHPKGYCVRDSRGTVYAVEVASPPADDRPVSPPNPKQIYGDKKAKVQLVPPALTLGAAVALAEGAEKYGAYNWRDLKVESLTYCGAILRHLYAYMDGEDLDPESEAGKSHLQGIAGCIAILLDATEGGFLLDNRPARGPAPLLVRTPKDGK